MEIIKVTKAEEIPDALAKAFYIARFWATLVQFWLTSPKMLSLMS